MLELQKSFLLVKFFNQILCNKGLKAKISCFFLCFFGAGKFKLQKNHFVLDITKAEEIQKSASTELHKWSKNVGNVENCNFLKVNCGFLLINLSEMKTVSMFYNSSLLEYFLQLVSSIFCSGDI